MLIQDSSTLLEKKEMQQRMSGKLRTIGITFFGIVQILKNQGIDLGVNKDDIFHALEIVSGCIAAIGAAISWGKLLYRKIKNTKNPHKS